MTAALTPEAALAWLATVTPALRAAVVLDAGGAVVAGDPTLGRRVREALAVEAVAAESGAPHGIHVAPDGIHLARGPAHVIAAEADPVVLGSVLLADLRAAVAALAAPGTPP
jgi:hypothetical protein